jgi:hypothetical protein
VKSQEANPARPGPEADSAAPTPLDSLDPFGACLTLAEAIDPRSADDKRWAAMLASAQKPENERKIAEGLCEWGWRSVIHRDRLSKEAWAPLGQALGRQGPEGEAARARFEASLGRFGLERAKALAALSGAQPWSNAKITTEAVWCDAALCLLEAIPAGAAGEIARPWALAALGHWSGVGGEGLSLWLPAERMRGLLRACDERRAVSIDEAQAFARAAVDATPGRSRNAWETYVSLRNALDSGRLETEMALALRACRTQKPLSPSEWTAAVSRGPGSEERAARLIEWGLVDEEMAARMLRLKSLDPKVRAKMEERALRGELRSAAIEGAGGLDGDAAGAPDEANAGARRSRRRL